MNDSDKLDPMVDRLWSQMQYAYTSGGGHSGHLNNAGHTARLLSKELRRLNETVADLAERNGALSRKCNALQETLHDEIDKNLRLRELGKADHDEGMTAFIERLIRERNRLENERQTYIEQVVSLRSELRNYREREQVQGWAEQ